MHNRIMKALATAGAIVLGLGLSLVTATSAQATTDPIYVEVSIEISPATCDVGEVASVNLDTLNHGEVTSTSGLTGPGTYSITITADPDAQFGPDGALGGSKTFTGPLAGPLDCPDDPPADPIYVDSSIEISPATCDVGEVASVNLDTLNHGEVTSTSGLTGPGTYSITITADPDAQFGPDGALGGSKTFTGPLAGPLDCPDDPAPPVDSADPPTTTDKVLASTGLGDINPWVPIGAAIIVMIGIPMAVFAYRRYKTESVTAE